MKVHCAELPDPTDGILADYDVYLKSEADSLIQSLRERVEELENGVERIRVVASGEEQVADDDTEGMQIIDIMAQKILVK